MDQTLGALVPLLRTLGNLLSGTEEEAGVSFKINICCENNLFLGNTESPECRGYIDGAGNKPSKSKCC